MTEDEWRPIETAPRNTFVLLYVPSGVDNMAIQYRGALITSGYWDNIDREWCPTGATWRGPFIKPTHWMHLPPPPQDESRRVAGEGTE